MRLISCCCAVSGLAARLRRIVLADKRTIYYKHRKLPPIGVALTAAAGAAGAVGVALTIVVIVGIGI